MNTILSILGVQGKEDVVSNLLAYGINNDPDFARVFLASVCKTTAPYTTVQAATRVTVPGVGIPDLVVTAEEGAVCDLFVIENKIKANEGDDQTERYGQCFDALQQIMYPSATWRTTTGVFLTLFPDLGPRNKEFLKAEYSDLLIGLNDYRGGNDALLDILVESLRAEYNAFYSAARLDGDDLVLTRLSIQNNLDAGFLVFKQLFNGNDISYPRDLYVDVAFRASWSGRRSYNVTITKESWFTDQEIPRNGENIRFNSTKCFFIHIESQYNVLYKLLNVSLDYETDPYQSLSWIQRHIDERDYAAYVERRERCKEFIRRAALPGVSIKGRNNMIARIDVPCDATTTVAEFRASFIDIITPIAAAIDAFLQQEEISA